MISWQRAIAWGIAFLAAGPWAEGRCEAAGRNVVLVVADDQGLDAGCYGNRVLRTPHIDALAAQGTRFDFAFCTTASCSPSRSVILTGLYNHANGQYGLQHAEHHFTTRDFVRGLPVLLADEGYRTCSIGKVHVQPDSAYKFERFMNDGIQGGRNAVKMAENAEAFMREADPRPFFIYFCPTDPHRAVRGFANDVAHPRVTETRYEPGDVLVPEFLTDQPEVRRELAEYYQAISRVDQGVGRLMQGLKDSGHDGDTLVLYLSDNGVPFPGAKTNLYDSGTHLPLIVRSPDQKHRGGACRALVNWVDIAPTILEFSGVKPPPYALHGRSLLKILDETDPPGWDQVFGSHTFHEVTMYYPMRSIRTRQYKLILNLAHPLPYPFAQDLFDSPSWQAALERKDVFIGRRSVAAYVQRPRVELYDVKADPGELVNLADHPDQARTLADLESRLKAWQQQTKDPWLIKYVHE